MNISQSTVEKHIAVGLKKCAEYMTKQQSMNVSSEQSRMSHAPVTNIRGNKE